MITKVTIRNFKRLKEITFEFEGSVVIVGPNNSGKSTILQALTLWDIGIRKIKEYYNLKTKKSKRTGIAINRKDLSAIPVSSAKKIWHEQHVRLMQKTINTQSTSNILIDIIIEGYYKGEKWISALEFDYTNSETICVRLKEGYQIDENSFNERIAYLQPMSGIATIEDKLTQGAINRRIGEGKTADVLRNICYQLIYPETPDINPIEAEKNWKTLHSLIEKKFGVSLNKPINVIATGLIEMTYKENGKIYDISAAGRGFQQTVLLLAFIYSYPGSIILLDEPDAHLEVIRQRETYNTIQDIANRLNSQLFIASHSEVVLNQAADKDTIIGLINNDYIELNNQQEISQFRKFLTDIGWDKYFLAKTKKHILFLEGSTDLDMLKEFALKLDHPVSGALDKANIHYTGHNIPGTVTNYFFGLQNIIKDLKGIALFDRIKKNIEVKPQIEILQWEKREFENYFCFPSVFKSWAEKNFDTNLFQNPLKIMEECINDNTAPNHLRNLNDIWWSDTKMSETYLPSIFKCFYKKIKQPDFFQKGKYYKLITYLPADEIDNEIKLKLDSIYEVIKD